VLSSFLTIGCETYKTLWKMKSNFYEFNFGRSSYYGKREDTENVIVIMLTVVKVFCFWLKGGRHSSEDDK
jgi:hypothetical protein